ncbi:hypothetical protein [Sporolactobacillus sp. THM19-2]|uniref:hypothetical protein n=1 Tax=Sporolactobacillus sp. THM19-2 TaxID=2511171 RepID=UPI00102142F9|nr:hypothetical protein [Sporolactobacillus sp. THM19-2]RYL93661.1 hypothetical protein EWH91_04235 [Sporolactobacillus sp. THM19-2]
MFNTRVPFYREKENYTLFYDVDKNQLYRLPHTKRSSGLYIIAFLLVLYGSYTLNDIYQNYQGFMINLALSLITLPLSFVIAKIFYKGYYIQDQMSNIYIDQANLLNYAVQGNEQLHREVFGILFALVITIICFIIFFVMGLLQSLVIGVMGFVAVWVFVFMKPYSRIRLYKKVQRGEIKL